MKSEEIMSFYKASKAVEKEEMRFCSTFGSFTAENPFEYSLISAEVYELERRLKTVQFGIESLQERKFQAEECLLFLFKVFPGAKS